MGIFYAALAKKLEISFSGVGFSLDRAESITRSANYSLDCGKNVKKRSASNLLGRPLYATNQPALSDPMAVTGADPDHSDYEERYVTFGVSARNRLIVVSHTEEGETIRLISARKASKGERKLYEEG